MSFETSLFRASLVTIGRVSKQPHTVTLRGVKYNGKIYFSRHRPDSDWFKNAITNPVVVIKYNNSSYSGIAKIVTGDARNRLVSNDMLD